MKNRSAGRVRLAAFPLFALISLAVLVPAAPAAAASEFEPGTYVGIGWGRFREDSNLGYAATGNNYAAKFYVGYQFNDWLGLEGGFTDFDDLVYTTSATATDTVEVDSVYARANLFLPLTSGNKRMTALFAGAGVQRWDLKEKIATSGTTTSTVRLHDSDSVLAAGVVVRGRNSAFRFEYEVYKDIGTRNKTTAYGVDLQMYSVNFVFYF
jgi:hypothetical protein